MENLELQIPDRSHKEAAEDYKNEFFRNREPVINGSALLDQMDFDAWLANTTNNSKAETVRADWVVSSTFFAVQKENRRIVGMIDLRHSLGNPFLLQYGGHIGYSVRPSERRKGYAAEMLQQALAYAKTVGLNRVMLGCYADNFPSIKTIEKGGGKLAETKPFLDGKPMRLYWISLP